MQEQEKTIIGVLSAHGFQTDQVSGNANDFSSTLYKHLLFPVEVQLYYTGGDLEASVSSLDAYGVIVRDKRLPLPLLITSSAHTLEAWCRTDLGETGRDVEFWKNKIITADIK